MLATPLLDDILRNDCFTRGLADPEARVLIEWLVERAEELAEIASSPEEAAERLAPLCLRGRAIGRFVVLWCYQEEHGAAMQLAASERFLWPFPDTDADPCELMQAILDWEINLLEP